METDKGNPMADMAHLDDHLEGALGDLEQAVFVNMHASFENLPEGYPLLPQTHHIEFEESKVAVEEPPIMQVEV